MRKLSRSDPRLRYPLYTLAEAARYLDVPTSTLYSWARPREGSPLIPVVHARGHSESVPFIGFAEAFVIAAARKAGVPHHRVRPGVEAIRERAGGIEYALASQLVYTDGAEILLGQLEDDLEVARLNQKQFTHTVHNQLRLISYARDGFAESLQLPKYSVAKVTVDPRIASGRPLIESGGARVQDVISRALAGDTEGAIARDFAVPIQEVRELVGNA
jgi:uncharacterized protein (DUF433 family)